LAIRPREAGDGRRGCFRARTASVPPLPGPN
jgi:hypothetical protein